MPDPTQTSPRLLFLNRCYWPDSEATGQLLKDLCESLAGTYDVHVVCGQPNSPTVQDYVRQGIEHRSGVTIHRLRHTQFAKRMPAGRLINLISFTRAAASYLRRARIEADVVISETDPFLLPVIASKHARRNGARLVSYLQDIYPDVAEAIGKVKSGALTRRIRASLATAYHGSDRVVVLGSCMRDRLLSSPWSIPSRQLRILPNWADCESIVPLPVDTNPFRLRERLDDQFVVMHSGNMGLTQRLDVLLEATRLPEWPAGATLLLVGNGAARDALQAEAAADRNDRVRFLPYQPREQLAESLSAADLHVVSMHERITGCLCPSKLYGILAAGRPVLAIADEQTDLCRTVSQHELGWCCPPGDARAIARAVSQAVDQAATRDAAGRNARRIACQRYDRKVVTQQFADMIGELVPAPTTRGPRCELPNETVVLAGNAAASHP